MCFGKRNAEVAEGFNEPIDPFVAERIRDDTIEKLRPSLVPSNEHFVFMSQANFEVYLKTVPLEHKVR